MIFKFYNPESGSILIDDKDIYKYSANSLYNNLTYVPQETILLHSTIYDNIKIAKQDATNEEIYNAAKKAELHNFIESLEDKYNTIVGERGIKLSGGQRQRISIARAFLKDAPIILMDEATASLDVDNESLIQESISKLIENKTVLIIAHRMRTVDGVDKIVVLKEGVVAEQGKPQELKQQKGIYKHMVDMQMQSNSWKYQ